MRLRAVPPLTVVKPPPAYTVDPAPALPSALPFTFGSQDVAVPVVAANAASRLRVVAPLTVVKAPPAYTVEPATASASTVLPTLGSQDVKVPVASSAAKLVRVSPPIELTLPPASPV